MAVLELPPRASRDALLERLRDLLHLLESRSLEGELWIVEPGRVRVRQGEDH